MTVAVTDEAKIIAAVQQAVNHYGNTQEELVPILNEINREIGYLPAQALTEVSRLLKVPKSQLFTVASFYKMFSTKPVGKHVIHFCESAPCHVVGGRQVWQALQEQLGLKKDETSPDGKWTLMTTSCLGVCGVGPVFMIDDDIYGNVTPQQIPGIIARYS